MPSIIGMPLMEQWAKRWLKWPTTHWTDKRNGQNWFKIGNGFLSLKLHCDSELRSTLESMTEELVDWRLAAYIKSRNLEVSEEGQQAFRR